MKIVPYEVKSGSENMQTDKELLDYAISNNLKEPIFRLYGWQPACVSLGRNQKDDFLDKEFLKAQKIDVVRRLTGGRALLHDNEITYCFVCPVDYLKNGEHVITSYKEICQFLIDKFKTLGIELSFGTNKQVNAGYDYCMLISTKADLCVEGKKLIGSAQFRKQGYILQHGSILFDYDRALLEKIFGEGVSCEDIISVREINPEITKDDIIKILLSS